MEFACLWRYFFCFYRMDDIQLCKDIMNLKKELQSLVAIPGKGCFQLNFRIMLGWWRGGAGVRSMPVLLTQSEMSPQGWVSCLLSSYIPSSPYFLFPFYFLPLFNLPVSEFLFMLYFTAPLTANLQLSLRQGAYSLPLTPPWEYQGSQLAQRLSSKDRMLKYLR